MKWTILRWTFLFMCIFEGTKGNTPGAFVFGLIWAGIGLYQIRNGKY